MANTYYEKLKDPRWQKKRLEILERDSFTCRDCGAKDKTLHVHHCWYMKGGEPWDVPNGFLLTLCHECHHEREEQEHDAKNMFSMLLAKLSTNPDSGFSIKELCQSMAPLVDDQPNQYGGYTVCRGSDFQYLAVDRWAFYTINNPDNHGAKEMYDDVISQSRGAR